MNKLAGLLLALLLPLGACSADTAPAAEGPVQDAAASYSQPQESPTVAPEPAVTDEPGAPIVVAAQTSDAPPAAPAAPFRDGQHYQRLTPTQPTSSSPDQVEVAEFFMYTCPHCLSFEPYVQRWLGSKPQHVSFLRIPVNFNAVAGLHLRAFYAAESLGVSASVHDAFFERIHVKRDVMGDEAALAKFFAEHGVDEESFLRALKSFEVDTKTRRAESLARRYRITSVPTVIVNGKYKTDAKMAGSYPALLQVIDYLVAHETATARTPEAPAESG